MLPSGERNGSVSAPAGDSGGAKIESTEGNAVLEEAGKRLAALKRRQAMELQHVLTFELRRLAQEARNHGILRIRILQYEYVTALELFSFIFYPSAAGVKEKNRKWEFRLLCSIFT